MARTIRCMGEGGQRFPESQFDNDPEHGWLHVRKLPKGSKPHTTDGTPKKPPSWNAPTKRMAPEVGA
jgi:hypothetical protein